MSPSSDVYVVAGPSGLQDPDKPEVSAPNNDQIGAGHVPYIIDHSGTRTFAKTAAIEKTYRVRFNDQWRGRRLTELKRQLYRLFEDLLAKARQDINDNDHLRIIIRHQALNQAAVVPFQAAGEMNVNKILDKIESLLQSEESLAVDDSFEGIFLFFKRWKMNYFI